MWACSATAPHRVVSQAKAIVHSTLHETPPGATDWSCRSMAKAAGVSRSTVQRIWDAHGLQPHRVATFLRRLDRAFPRDLTLHVITRASNCTSRRREPRGSTSSRVGALFASTGPAASTGQPATGLIRVPQSDHHFDPRRPSAEKCPDRAQERHDAVRWCRLGSTDSVEEPEIVVARAMGSSNDEKPIP